MQLSAALERVRAGADIMPQRQLEQVMSAELGADWRKRVASFDNEPLAAASIGQVGSNGMQELCMWMDAQQIMCLAVQLLSLLERWVEACVHNATISRSSVCQNKSLK